MSQMMKLFWLATVVCTTLVEAYNGTIEEQPRRTVEIIELMIPRQGKTTEKVVGGTERVNSGEKSRYEIFIQPSGNTYNTKDAAKIKIFLESRNYNSGNIQAGKSNENFPAVPLSVSTTGSNVDNYQNVKTNIKQIEVQCNGLCGHSVEQNREQEVGRKSVTGTHSPKDFHHTVRDIGEDVNDYGGGYVKEERSNPLTSRDIPQENFSHRKTDEIKTYRTQESVPLAHGDGYRTNTTVSQHHDRQQFVEDPHLEEDNNSPSVGKILVYEPGAGISATEVNLSNLKRFAQQSQTFIERTHSRQPYYDLNQSETRVQTGRRITNENQEVRTDKYNTDFRGENGGRTYHASTALLPSPDSRPSGYRQNGGEPSVEYSSEERKRGSSHNSRGYNTETHRYNIQPEELGAVINTGLPYETVSDIKETEDNSGSITRRPVREESYLGFPDSYTANMYENVRPTSSSNTPLPVVSVCPGVFKYVRTEEDRWFGEIYVTTDEVLTGMRLDLTLSRRADLMTADIAEIKTPDNIHFTILSLKKKLVPRTTEVVEIMVKYNEEQSAPVLQKINLNGRSICPIRTNTKTTRKPVYAFPGDLEEQKPSGSNSRPSVNEYATTTRRPTTNLPTSTRRTTTGSYTPSNQNYVSVNRPATKKPNQRPGLGNSKPPNQNRPLPPGLNNPNVNNFNNRRPGTNVNYEINTGSSEIRPSDKEKRSIPCGLPAVQPKPLITNGQMTSRGQWPWHVALYKNIGPNLNYSCGGTLVSDTYVVTAAHCVTAEYTASAVDPKVLMVYLGKYHIYLWAENGVESRKVSRVTVHPEYNFTNFRSDIAIITLSSKVDYTDFIRPVCLWDKRNTRIDDVVGLQGTVVGWGFDTNHRLSEDLQQAKMPVVSYNVCLLSYPDFFAKFTSNTTYCAGFKNGTSACNGDSGGGMFFPISVDGGERWFLRGLVSLSPAVKGAPICDNTHYVVFTDVAKFLPWIEDVISRG